MVGTWEVPMPPMMRAMAGILRGALQARADLRAPIGEPAKEQRIAEEEVVEAEVEHLLDRRIGVPAFLDDAIGGDRIAGAILTVLAVHEHRRALRVCHRPAQGSEEEDDLLLARTRSDHRNMDIG